MSDFTPYFEAVKVFNEPKYIVVNTDDLHDPERNAIHLRFQQDMSLTTLQRLLKNFHANLPEGGGAMLVLESKHQPISRFDIGAGVEIGEELENIASDIETFQVDAIRILLRGI